MGATILHLIYVHGFRGDHTSFLTFPSDVHGRVLAKIGSKFTIESYLYPTYPSVRPLEHATKQFLTWLAEQPPGPVILFAHSMGGLLAAEVAISSSPAAQRVVGVVGLDVPFLGLHPHVIISGIASLLPAKSPSPAPPEEDLNKNKVQIVTQEAAFQPSGSSDSLATQNSVSVLESPRAWFANVVEENRDHPIVSFLRRHSDDVLGGVHRWIVKNLEFGSAMYDARGLLQRYDALVQWSAHGNKKFVNYWTTTVASTNDALIDAPELLVLPVDVPSGTPGLGQPGQPSAFSLPFGPPSQVSPIQRPWWHSALPNEQELKERLSSYLPWSSGKKSPRPDRSARTPSPLPSSTASLDISTPSTGDMSAHEETPHHFIVLPYNEGSRRAHWHKIVIAGASDEVSAHQGIFMRHRNLAYDNFVERVARLIELWSATL